MDKSGIDVAGWLADQGHAAARRRSGARRGVLPLVLTVVIMGEVRRPGRGCAH
jgi:hypothetical protein